MTDHPPLQMIRAAVSVRDFQRWMGQKRLQDSDHAMHCLLAECFGPDLAPKPFRLLLPRGCPKGTLYGYGPADAAALREKAAIFADPAQSRILPADGLESKAMPAAWQAGQRLGFEVRLRPIVRRRNPESNRPDKAREWDAFQWAAEQYPKGEMPYSREEIYRDWLQGELTRHGGAELESASAVLRSFQRTRAVRKLRARPQRRPGRGNAGQLDHHRPGGVCRPADPGRGPPSRLRLRNVAAAPPPPSRRRYPRRY